MAPSNPQVETTMNEAFERLYWPIFTEPADIRVLEEQQTPFSYLLPFEGHPIASEPATVIPYYEISFGIETINDFFPEDEDHVRPPIISVRRDDNGIVTVKDVVDKLGPYLVSHKEVILQTVAGLIGAVDEAPPDTRVFFNGFRYTVEPEDALVTVELWTEGEWGETMEQHWGYYITGGEFGP